MKQVHHRPNGMVWVTDGSKEYHGTLAEFATAYGQAMPPLPEGIDEELYEPGIRHPYSASNSVIDGGPIPWPLGDSIIAAIDSLIAAMPAGV